MDSTRVARALREELRSLEESEGLENGDVGVFVMADTTYRSCCVDEIKLLSIQLAWKYMKRVASEIDGLDGPKKEPTKQFLLIQAFVGGFDVESMKAFEELRSCVSPPLNQTNRLVLDFIVLAADS